MNWKKGIDYPEWMDDAALQTLQKGYLFNGESPADAIRAIGQKVGDYMNSKTIGKKVEQYIWNGWICPSTPMWSNFRHKRAASISCFNSHISDSIDNIGFTLSETMKMTQLGGGTSCYWGDVRARGAAISGGGKTNGSVSFMEMYDTMINKVSQGGVRRGAIAMYLPITHGDIEEFLQIKEVGNPLQNLFFAVCIDDEFIEKLYQGDHYSLKIWSKVLKSRATKGLPYIFFTDNVNNHPSTPNWYGYKQSNPDFHIRSSNLCVTGDQKVVTSKGIISAFDLYKSGDELIIFDGKKARKASAMKLIEKDVDVYKITLANGMTHTVTDYHKVKVKDGDRKSKMIACKDLKIGDKVYKQVNKGLFGDISMEDEAFLLGLYQADGTQNGDRIHLDIWENDFDLEYEIEGKFKKVFRNYGCNTYSITNQYNSTFERIITAPKFREVVGSANVRKKRLSSNCMSKNLGFRKGFIPDWIWRGTEKTQWEYVKGLFYADGTVSLSKSSIYLAITNTNKEFMEDLQILLANLGMNFNIHTQHEGGERLLPDGKGGQNLYDCKPTYRLVCGNKNDALVFEENTKFLSRKGVFVENRLYKDNTKKWSEVVSVEYVGKEDVYCLTVDSEEHVWTCNGVITSNCTEIALPSNEDESFVCCVASMNAYRYDEWKDTDAVFIMNCLMDAVMEDFIYKTRNIKLMRRANKFAKNHRALGIGVLGWHSYLQSKNLPFVSVASKSLNKSVFENLKLMAEESTMKLGKKLGASKIGDGLRRNSTMLSIAPTVSNSTIQSVSPSTEAWASNYFVQKSAKGNFVRKNLELEKVLVSLGKNTEEVWESIKDKLGSVQHLDFLDNDTKAVFETFKEINQFGIIDQAADRQMFIDQAQSLNLNIPPNVSAKDVSKLHLYAHSRGIKTLYYQRSESMFNNMKTMDADCLFCQA